MPMNGLPYYKAYPRDFIEGTIGMPLELKGAYRLVLDLIYMQGGNLPDNAGYISGLIGCSPRKWTSLRAELIARGKLRVIGELLTNYRADNELAQLGIFQNKQRINATKDKENNEVSQAMAEPDGKPKPSHTESDTDTERKEETPPTPLALVEPKRAAPSALVREFEKVWAAYPRKVGVGNARKAWLKARRATEFETIAGPLREFIRATRGDEMSKIPHFATWLNGERWNDDQSHARNGPRSSTEDLAGLSRLTPTEDIARLMAPQLKAIGQ